jgi:hypothetical protein
MVRIFIISTPQGILFIGESPKENNTGVKCLNARIVLDFLYRNYIVWIVYLCQFAHDIVHLQYFVEHFLHVRRKLLAQTNDRYFSRILGRRVISMLFFSYSVDRYIS